MKKLTTHFLIALLIFLSIIVNVQGQIAISNLSEVEKIKNGTTYVVMKDPSSRKVKEYITVFEDNWTISKVEFIKYSEIENYLSPESSFLMMGGFETITSTYTSTHLYLELWTVNDKFFQSRRRNKKFGNIDKVQVARIELYTDYETQMNPKKIFEYNFDGSGHISNWGPGILKNYIQALMGYLNSGKTRTLYAGIRNREELKNLRYEVLYVPDYVLIKFSNLTGDKAIRIKEKKIFKNYKFKYELISTDALNRKILSDRNSFYYLVYVKSSTDKYVSVINSATGEIIYTQYSPISNNFKSRDMKKLQRRVR